VRRNRDTGGGQEEEQEEGRAAVVVVGERGAVVEASSEACCVAALGHPRRRTGRFSNGGDRPAGRPRAPPAATAGPPALAFSAHWRRGRARASTRAVP
jgi:hypothetical protein